MDARNVAVVILAAGHGTRMKSALPKVLHSVGGRAMLAHSLACADALGAARRIVVVGDHAPQVGTTAQTIDPSVSIAVQAPPRGTGDAVIQAMPALDGFEGTVVVLYADTPLITPATLHALVEKISQGAGVAVLGFRPDNPGAYGRLITDTDGALTAIVEAKDASPAELSVQLVNSGVMAIESEFLRDALPQLTPNNAKNEYYLTDLVAIARKQGATAVIHETDDPDEVIGVNSRVELASAEALFQNRRRSEMMTHGVTLIDPATTYFHADTKIASDVMIEPNVFFGPGVTVESDVHIKAFCHIEGAVIASGAVVGPFARLRPGASIGEKAHVGNFVEIKKSTLGAGAKVNHLTYIGDARIGARANIGAGTITCNYDGYGKHQTIIGNGAFIGSNSALVAPVEIGAGAYIGSGSVITKPVSDNALAVARGRQAEIPDWATKFRKANGDNA